MPSIPNTSTVTAYFVGITTSTPKRLFEARNLHLSKSKKHLFGARQVRV
jgi:hypothetical protein